MIRQSVKSLRSIIESRGGSLRPIARVQRRIVLVFVAYLLISFIYFHVVSQYFHAKKSIISRSILIIMLQFYEVLSKANKALLIYVTRYYFRVIRDLELHFERKMKDAEGGQAAQIDAIESALHELNTIVGSFQECAKHFSCLTFVDITLEATRCISFPYMVISNEARKLIPRLLTIPYCLDRALVFALVLLASNSIDAQVRDGHLINDHCA